MMCRMEVLNSPAVRHNMSLELPLLTQYLFQKHLASAAGLAIGTVVSAHHRFYMRFLNAGFEGWKISLPQILLIDLCIKLMTQCFRAAVYRKMLGTGRCLQVLGIVSLQSLNKRYAQSGRQIRILSVGLMSSAPARVTEYIDIGGPECQTLIQSAVSLLCVCLILGSSFCSDYIRDLK